MGNGEDLVKRFDSLKKRSEHLKSIKIVLETKISSKKEELISLEKDIFKNFKVKTLEEARVLFTESKSKLEEKLTKLEEELSPFESVTGFEGGGNEESDL